MVGSAMYTGNIHFSNRARQAPAGFGAWECGSMSRRVIDGIPLLGCSGMAEWGVEKCRGGPRRAM
jgi:hypothetical protein